MPIDTAVKRYSALNPGCVWRGTNVVPGSVELAAGVYLYAGIGADPPVEVPDVVGDTQAAGTATLEAEGFVVAVTTDFDPVVPAGAIISQNPLGGSFAAFGSTVTIVVSLGPQPVPPAPEGGGTVGSTATRRRKRAPEPDQFEFSPTLRREQLARNRVEPDTVAAQPPPVSPSKPSAAVQPPLKSREESALDRSTAAQLRRADEIAVALEQRQAQERVALEQQQREAAQQAQAEQQRLIQIAIANEIAIDDAEAMDALRVLIAAGLL